MFYLTDTGRRWDGDRVSVRDKVDEDCGIRNLEFAPVKCAPLLQE